ncbi:hypothetical protein ACRAWF_02815 [Streptomyces sp. L7]
MTTPTTRRGRRPSRRHRLRRRRSLHPAPATEVRGTPPRPLPRPHWPTRARTTWSRPPPARRSSWAAPPWYRRFRPGAGS